MLETMVIGYIGKDAKVTEVNGKAAVNFSVAHSEKYKDAQGVVHESTTWVDCTKWDGEKLAPHLKSGTLVMVKGFPGLNVYANKEGKPSGTIRLRVMQVQLLGGSKKEASSGAANSSTPAPENNALADLPGEVVDDLPF